MKKTILALIVSAIVIASCKKDNVTTINPASFPVGTFSADVDGKAVSFESYVLMYRGIGSDTLILFGVDTLQGASASVTMEVYGRDSILAKTYSSILADTASDLFVLGYQPNILASTCVSTLAPPLSTITITSITDSTIQGTFGGFLIYDSLGIVLSHNITNGVFNLKPGPTTETFTIASGLPSGVVPIIY
jgi:hypothetical protein